MGAADIAPGSQNPRQMTQMYHPQPSTTAPISRREIHSFSSTAPSTSSRPHHSHNVSDVSASTEPERPSPAAATGLAVMPEREGNLPGVDPELQSPVSPPTEERVDPIGSGALWSSGGSATPARTHQSDSQGRRRAKGSFEEDLRGL
jgi:hypothetical protein